MHNNMKAFAALAVVCVLLPLVAGHGWVTNPQPRGYTGTQDGASQTAACGAAGTYPQVVTLTNGDYLNVSWTIGGGHDGTGVGPNTCRFAWSLSDTSTTDFNSHVLIDGLNCSAGNKFKSFQVNTAVTTPSTAYLQFRWSAGDGGVWYNCVKMYVSPVGVSVNDAVLETPFSDTVSPTETIYYKVDADSNKHVYVTLTATGATNFALSGGSLPSTVNDSEYWVSTTAGKKFGLSACSNVDSDTTFYLAAFGGSSDVSFTATAETYDAMLFPVYKAPQIKDSLPEGGSKFYWTEAYTETGLNNKRVYVKKTDGSGWVRLWKSLSCTLDNTDSTEEAVNDWGEHGACVDLTTTEGRKYIQVESLNGTKISFDLGVEDGLCADKNLNGASTAHISFMVLVAALVMLLL